MNNLFSSCSLIKFTSIKDMVFNLWHNLQLNGTSVITLQYIKIFSINVNCSDSNSCSIISSIKLNTILQNYVPKGII